MKKIATLSTISAALLSVALLGCSNEPVDPAFQASAQLPQYQQDSFEQYQKETRAWLAENRVFVTDNKQQELDANAPTEYRPLEPNGKAVLLVHGLGDSPYSFVDIATHLQEQGYLVRTILLPGHGSKAGDLMLPTLSDWQQVVAHHTKLLQQDYDSVWLGGYSTGANLVTSQAIHDPSISGLMLFSPAFQPNSPAVQYASLASNFITWADQDPEDNYLRYNSLPMNGAAVYYQTSEAVREDLEQAQYDKPVFIMMSEGDSVIDTQYVADQFSAALSNPNNALIWQGETSLADPRSQTFSMQLDQQRISNGSHMGLLFSPDNPNYGINGSERICNNGQETEAEAKCSAGEEIWYSAYGHQEAGKIHARLTYNPYFAQSMQMLDKVMSSDAAKIASK